VRFRIGFDPAGLMPLVEPVEPLPPDPRATQPATARLRLPFDGLWWATVAPTPEIGNHHVAASDQRHAFDFVIWQNGATHRGQGQDNADYWAWGQALLAPAQGTVVAVHDGVADNRPGTETNTAQPAGNHVVVDLGHGEFAALVHFRKGSIRVAKGDFVTSGQVLGLVGNSGNSSEPISTFTSRTGPGSIPADRLGSRCASTTTRPTAPPTLTAHPRVASSFRRSDTTRRAERWRSSRSPGSPSASAKL